MSQTLEEPEPVSDTPEGHPAYTLSGPSEIANRSAKAATCLCLSSCTNTDTFTSMPELLNMFNTTIAQNCGDHTNSLFEKKQIKARR
jgi:hypothetical protein